MELWSRGHTGYLCDYCGRELSFDKAFGSICYRAYSLGGTIDMPLDGWDIEALLKAQPAFHFCEDKEVFCETALLHEWRNQHCTTIHQFLHLLLFSRTRIISRLLKNGYSREQLKL